MSWEPFDGNINDGIFNESNDIETIPEIIMADTTEEPRIDIAASIQSSLIEMETTLHNREKELEELKLSHSQEIENILLQEQTKRNNLLQEIKETNAHQLVYNDNDEREAKRIEQLKNTLRHLHNEEMEKIQISHQKEKMLLIEENNKQLTELHKICDEKIETNKTKLEHLANEQIKQIHSQFMLSYNSLMKQKCEFEDKNKQLIDGLCDTTKQLDLVMEEKRIMEDKIQQLEKNHVMEVDAMKETSFDMEKIMKEWKDKASKLQEKINTTTITQSHSTNEEMIIRLQEQLEDKEKELLEIRKADKEEIKIIQKLENRLTEQDSLYKNKISEMEIAHQMEIENKRDQQVSLLEESISETSKSQASLEFAEVHMKELQQQLNAYRNQEIDHKTAMEQTQLDQQQEMKELIERNDHKIIEISDNHKKETQELKLRFEELQQNIKENEMKYQLEVTEILERTKTENDIATEKIINELKKEHCDKKEEISREHQKDIEEMKIHIEDMKKNMEIEKQQEIEEIHHKHKTTMAKLKESLSSVNEISIRDAQTRIIDLELSLRETEENSKQMRILQEKIQKIDTELRAKEVELSICQSELNNEQMKLSNTREMMDDYMKKYNETSYDELNNSLIKERNETTTRYQDMLQQKEDEIATNQSHLKTQQLRITELTEELAQERKGLEEKKAENNPGVNETELVNVQSELIEAKQRCDTLLKDWNNKELEHDKLRNELSDLQGNITNQERQHDNRIMTLELQAEQLTKNLTSATDKLTDTTSQLQEILKERDALLNDKETLTTDLESIQEQLTTKENDRQQLLEDMKNTNITITDKCALIGQENDLLLTRINELELEVCYYYYYYYCCYCLFF